MDQNPSTPSHPYASPVTDQMETGPLKASGLGITSFILGIVSGLSSILIIGYAGYLEISTAGDLSENAAMAIGFSMLLSLGCCFVGACLGVAAMFQTNRSKVFGAIGLAINVMIILGVIGLMILGMTLG